MKGSAYYLMITYKVSKWAPVAETCFQPLLEESLSKSAHVGEVPTPLFPTPARSSRHPPSAQAANLCWHLTFRLATEYLRLLPERNSYMETQVAMTRHGLLP